MRILKIRLFQIKTLLNLFCFHLGQGNYYQTRGLEADWVYLVFIFVCIQVFIGGTIRDIPDLSSDEQEGVNSLPVVLGANRTIFILHAINLIAGSSFIFFKHDIEGCFLFGLITIWRFINLIMIQKDSQNSLWTQQLNLFTCVLLFLILLFLKLYGSI